MPKVLFTPKEAAKVSGVSYRQLQYWDRSNFIKPSHHTPKGNVRRYTFYDIFLLWIANCRRDRGDSIQGLRETIKNIQRSLPKLTFPLTETTLWFLDNRIFFFHGEAMVSPPGDLVAIRAKDIADVVAKLFPDKTKEYHEEKS